MVSDFSDGLLLKKPPHYPSCVKSPARSWERALLIGFCYVLHFKTLNFKNTFGCKFSLNVRACSYLALFAMKLSSAFEV